MLISLSEMYSMYVEDFMVRDVKYIWQGMTYGKLKEILKANRSLRSLPLVDNPGMCTIFTLALQSEYCWKMCCGKHPLYFKGHPTTLHNCFLFLLYIIILPHLSFCYSVSHFSHFSIWSISYHIIYFPSVDPYRIT